MRIYKDNVLTESLETIDLDFQLSGIKQAEIDRLYNIQAIKQLQLNKDIDLTGVRQRSIEHKLDVIGKRDIVSILEALDLI